MRTLTIIFACAALIASIVSYRMGHRSGSQTVREERKVDIIYANGMYKAAATTNLPKLHSFLDIKLLALVREYEQRWGVPPPTNNFGRSFAEAKIAADRIESTLVPAASIATNFGSNVQIHFNR